MGGNFCKICISAFGPLFCEPEQEKYSHKDNVNSTSDSVVFTLSLFTSFGVFIVGGVVLEVTFEEVS